MHHLSVLMISAAMFVIVLLVASVVCMVEAFKKDDDPPPILSARVRVPVKVKYQRAVCEDCGKPVSIRKDGRVHRRHKCHITEEAA